MNNYEKLFSPIQIGNVTIKNRIVMESMGVCVAEAGGMPGKRYYDYYEARAKGGCGLICTEVTRYHDGHGAVAWGQLSMSDDRYIEPFRKVVDMVHSYGSKIFVQLHHPGRQNEAALAAYNPAIMKVAKVWPGVWDKLFAGMTDVTSDDPDEEKIKQNQKLKPLLAPSAIPADLGMSTTKGQPVREMTVKEIKELIRLHGEAAERVKKSGADGVVIHAASGYLIQEFLSPYTNQRNDEYGGNFENRFRFVKELIEDVRRRCGKDFAISVRLCVDECYETIGYPGRGITLDLGIQICKALEKCGVDVLDVTTGNYETFNSLVEPISYPELWKKEIVAKVKAAVNIPVIAVGVIRTPKQAESLLEEGVQDMIGLGRPVIADPMWAKKAEEGRSEDIVRCISCLNCFVSLIPNGAINEPIECAMNPRGCREYKYPEIPPKDGNGRTIVVVGAGPAGLTAAKELALRDFKVVVLEKDSVPGGQLLLAAKPLRRGKMNWAAEDLAHQAELAGAVIVYNTEANVENIMAYKPDAVFVTTGGVNLCPNISGIDGANVYLRDQILNREVNLKNKNVAVIGSGITGLEIAELLVEEGGNHVTVVEMADKIAPGAYPRFVWELKPQLDSHCVNFRTGTKLLKIEKDHIVIENVKDERQEKLYVDNVVIAMGVKRVDNLVKELEGKVKVISAGDCVKIGRIPNATHAAYKAAREF